jgi:Protein of unknown function (DUF3108)
MKGIAFRIFLLWMTGISLLQAEEPVWKKLLTPEQSGNFSAIPPFHAQYEFGWTNIGAAKAEVVFYYLGDHYFFSASGGTYGWARKLWQLDALQRASGFRGSWLPDKMYQSEQYRSYTMIMDVRYNKSQADRLRMAIPTPGKPPARKIFSIENMRDMVAAMLFIRSQPLRNGDQISQVVFPGDSAFFVQSRVLGRETIRWGGKPMPTIKLSLSMKRILMEGPQQGNLVVHSKFRSGVVWISDDKNRMPLRMEMNIFIGYVYAQLQSVWF